MSQKTVSISTDKKNWKRATVSGYDFDRVPCTATRQVTTQPFRVSALDHESPDILFHLGMEYLRFLQNKIIVFIKKIIISNNPNKA